MHIVQTVPSLTLEYGGPSRSVTGLSSALAQEKEIAVGVISQTGRGPDATLIRPSDLVKLSLLSSAQIHVDGLLFFRNIWRHIDRLVQGDKRSIIHDHGVWSLFNHTVARVARRANIPLIVSLRGMLEPWALNRSATKKQLAWYAYQRGNLMSARLLHATCEDEAQNLRRLGLRQPIAVVPNGVDVGPHGGSTYVGDHSHKRKLLFLSRLHPKKGLLDLIEALEIALPASWEVLIAGPDEDNHRREVESAIRRAQLEHQITFIGPVDDTQKWDLYRQADLFVLPSFSENFGLVIAEALAAGVPVITTKSTPWREIEAHRCGWWIDGGVDPLAAALGAAFDLTDEQRKRIGANGSRLVEAKYGWSKIAAQMLGVYRWVLFGGRKPDCVDIV